MLQQVSINLCLPCFCVARVFAEGVYSIQQYLLQLVVSGENRFIPIGFIELKCVLCLARRRTAKHAFVFRYMYRRKSVSCRHGLYFLQQQTIKFMNGKYHEQVK